MLNNGIFTKGLIIQQYNRVIIATLSGLLVLVDVIVVYILKLHPFTPRKSLNLKLFYLVINL